MSRCWAMLVKDHKIAAATNIILLFHDIKVFNFWVKVHFNCNAHVIACFDRLQKTAVGGSHTKISQFYLCRTPYLDFGSIRRDALKEKERLRVSSGNLKSPGSFPVIPAILIGLSRG